MYVIAISEGAISHIYNDFLLTLYPDLPAAAVGTGQQGKLLSLVHGVVSTRHDNMISWLPRCLYFIL